MACNGGVDLASYAALRGATREEELGRERRRRTGEEKRASWLSFVSSPPPRGLLIYGDGGQACPFPKARGRRSREGKPNPRVPKARAALAGLHSKKSVHLPRSKIMVKGSFFVVNDSSTTICLP
jgi:hypothetical protein